MEKAMNTSKPKNYKLISTFQPAFTEPSEMTFIDGDSARLLSILIRKDFRIDVKEDTFYYKAVQLDTQQTAIVHRTMLSRLDSSLLQGNKAGVDGISIAYRYVQNGETLFYSFHSPSKATNSSAFELASATLGTYQGIFKDTIISDYFNEVRMYLSSELSNQPTTITPLKRLREVKYNGFIKYSR